MYVVDQNSIIAIVMESQTNYLTYDDLCIVMYMCTALFGGHHG